MDAAKLFEELKTGDIYCLGHGKYFKNSTLPFLKSSGLLENLRGFVEPDGKPVVLQDRSYDGIPLPELSRISHEKTVLLIAVKGYREILSQLRADAGLAHLTAIPSLYLEALYEDKMMLSAKQAPAGFRKHEIPVIPKVIHAIWFSDNPLPGKYRQCLESWKKYAPDFEIKIWDLTSYQPESCLFFEQAVSDRNWAFASDYARADLLRRFGGIYMDLDVEMIRPIDDLIYNDAYMSFESLGRIECGSGMGATKGNRIIDEICKSYESRPYFKEDGTWDNSTCPVRYTRVIEKHGLIKNGGFQFVEDITIYPFEVLTAKSFDTGIIYKTDRTCTVHHHNGTWVPTLARDAMKRRYQEIGELLQRESLWKK